MKTLATDENRDLFLSGNGIAEASGIRAVLNLCERVMLTQTKELQYDTSRGIPYFQTVFSSGQSLPAWSAICITALEAVQGVKNVVSFDYGVLSSVLKYRAVIETVYGEGTIYG
jgi:hypothetical protein